MRRLLWALFLGSSIAIVVLGTFTVAGIVLSRGWADATACQPEASCRKQPFDSRLWKAYGNWTEPVRLWMIDDLSASYGLRDKPRAWIDDQLGTPETANRFLLTCEYVYWLGPARGLASAQFEWLCLNFTDGIVTDARLIRG